MGFNKALATIACGTMEIAFCQDGGIKSVFKDDILVTRYIRHSIDSDLCAVHLRLDDGRISPVRFTKAFASSDTFRLEGEVFSIPVTLEYVVSSSGWRESLSLGAGKGGCEVFFTFAPALGTRGFVLENELYASQYLGHSAFDTDEAGWVVSSRQNLDQNGRFPTLQLSLHGARAVAFSTDESTLRRKAKDRLDFTLDSKVVQGESAMVVMQSGKLSLAQGATVSLLALVDTENQDRIRGVKDAGALLSEPQDRTYRELALAHADHIGPGLDGEEVSPHELERLYPTMRLVERKDGKVQSFFTEDHCHVVTRDKEERQARSTGTILLSGPDLTDFTVRRLSTTCGMCGLFNSHVVVGNTNYDKMLSSSRSQYDTRPSLGMRIYIRKDGVYRRLATASLFEMSPCHCKWTYVLEDDVVTVTVWTDASSPALALRVASRHSHDFLISSLLCLGKHENMEAVDIVRSADDILVSPGEGNPAHSQTYRMHWSCPVSFHHDDILMDGGFVENEDLVLAHTPEVKAFSMTIGLDGAHIGAELDERKALARLYDEVLCSLRIEGGGQAGVILDETLHTYIHNALVHYLMPHGLEQQNGAAWGTRDISQGPFEVLMALGHFSAARRILLCVFAHQSRKDRQWPQWFMFDCYKDAFDSCHGDVVFWPLGCLADYIAATGDLDILDEELPYLDDATKQSLEAHLALAIEEIGQRFIAPSHLVSYDGGDWDDTLQPVDAQMKRRMVSSWTQALAYQVLSKLATALQGRPLAGKIGPWLPLMKADYEERLIKDGCVAGFLVTGEDGGLLLHPADQLTGIHYRLISMTRGIIAGLVDGDLADSFIQTIEDRLHYPDGVHLMDRPTRYDGGLSHLFVRAERAANVGREISLEYVHANIRHIEALARCGYSDLAWKCLFEINPILLQQRVPMALSRQSNVYFSSSDGLFSDRYDYYEHFDLLKEGKVPVAGGWRLYSSGPGIYLATLLRHIFGLVVHKDSLTISPVLSQKACPLTLDLTLQGRRIRLCYVASHEERIELDGKTVDRVIPLSRLVDGSSLTVHILLCPHVGK